MCEVKCVLDWLIHGVGLQFICDSPIEVSFELSICFFSKTKSQFMTKFEACSTQILPKL